MNVDKAAGIDASAHDRVRAVDPTHGVAADLSSSPDPHEDVPGGPSIHERLDALDGLPLAEHPDVYADIHRDLQAALADVDG